LWDYENKKIIRSIYSVFNEKVIYKDQLKGKIQEKEKLKYTVLDEITEKKIQRYRKIKMYNNMSNKYLKLLQVLLEYLPG
jgi:hypothetical protein